MVVIGAGVSGLTTAVCLAEAGLTVRVDAEHPPAATTSAAAGAAWDPYLVEPQDRVREWSAITFTELTALARDPDATGVQLLDGTHQSMLPRDVPVWAPSVGARPCAREELRAGYALGWHYRSPIIDMSRYLPHLTRRLTEMGGHLRAHTYRSPAEAMAQAPIVVNCSGIGARRLVPDPTTTPVRGRLVVVANPGITEFFCDDTPDAEDLVYIYPQGERVVLGGTAEPDVWSLSADPAASAAILRRCAAVEPLLRDATVLGHRSGLRPVRPEVRLEAQDTPHGRLLHNYGHGGAGVTVSWGCAREIVRLLHEAAPLTT